MARFEKEPRARAPLSEVRPAGWAGVSALAAVVATLLFTGGAQASATHRCSVRGYNWAYARGVSCRTAGSILWRTRQGSGSRRTIAGWHCREVSHAPGGQGFPIEAICTKGHARAWGDIFDGPA